MSWYSFRSFPRHIYYVDKLIDLQHRTTAKISYFKVNPLTKKNDAKCHWEDKSLHCAFGVVEFVVQVV